MFTTLPTAMGRLLVPGLLLLGLAGCGDKETVATAAETKGPRNQVEAAQQKLDAAVGQAQERLDQSLEAVDEQTR